MKSNPIFKLKDKIKHLVAEQTPLKNQRKTVNLKGKRLIPAWDAQITHADNRIRLRHMYLAYGLLKHKTIEQIECSSKTPYNESTVSMLVEKYSPEAVRISA